MLKKGGTSSWSKRVRANSVLRVECCQWVPDVCRGVKGALENLKGFLVGNRQTDN